MKLQQAVAEIDLAALSHNLGIAQKRAGSADILAVVKADAYGHGANTLSNHLITSGAAALGVAFTHEAIALRESGITCPILVFFDRDNIREIIDYNLTPVVFDVTTAEALSKEARKANRDLPIHIKVDTGMGRVGFCMDKAKKEILNISRLKNIRLEGLMSHFSEADLENKEFAEKQVRSFVNLVSELKQKSITFRYHHMSNSAAILSMPDAHFNMVRPGIMLYGYGVPEGNDLKPVLTLKSTIVLLKKVPKGTPISYGRTFITKKPSVIATVPFGYADGYCRALSNQGEVLICGKRVPVIGRVCMDTIMIDVTEIDNIDYHSEVVLLGKQGREQITADEIAAKTDTIPYEVLTSIGQRVKRVYRKSG